jgi:hypothetical protein
MSDVDAMLQLAAERTGLPIEQVIFLAVTRAAEKFWIELYANLTPEQFLTRALAESGDQRALLLKQPASNSLH